MSHRKLQPPMTEVLRAAIRESGLTDYKIAEATGVLATSIGRFMRGESSLRLDKADKLAAYLGLRLVPDPDAVPPEPTPESRARPTLGGRRAKRKAQ
jgi:transcriptional regulator with XRE-family HTH domain